MKKIISTIILCVFVISFSAEANIDRKIQYAKWNEDYDYSSNIVYEVSDKSTGEIIPFSLDPLDGYAYAYIKNNYEIEITKTKYTNKFSDVDKDDYWVIEMTMRNVFNGFSDGTFKPDNFLTRAEMSTVLTRLFSVEQTDLKSCFLDVSSSDWYKDYVMALVNCGIFKEDTLFNPNSFTTREELTTTVYRMLCNMNMIDTKKNFDFTQYKDVDTLSAYSKKAYNDMLASDYILLIDRVDNDFEDMSDDEIYLKTNENVSRGECTEFLYNFIRMFMMNNAPAIKRNDSPNVEIPVLDGSTSTYPITENIYNIYYNNAKNYESMPKSHSKTSNSYKNLIDGKVEMIFVPDPSEEIKNYTKEKGVNLRYIPIANEALIFFTSNDNQTGNITREQLKEIYTNNSIKNWNEIGKNNNELVAYCRNNDSGSHAQMEKFILDGETINEEISKERTSFIMSSILTDVDDFNNNNRDKYAIGYSLFYFYNMNQTILGPLNLKMLSINGIMPTEDTLSDGTYPFTTHYYAVVRDEKNEKVDNFVKLMQGEFGEEVVQLSGFGAIKNKEN